MNEPEKVVPFPKEESAQTKPQVKRTLDRSSLFLYSIALFAMAAVLIFMSYLSTEQHKLQQENKQFQTEIASLRQQIERLEGAN